MRWPWKQPVERPSLAAGLRAYVVGDLHGRRDLLADMLGRIDKDRARQPKGMILEIFLGDYIDRGPDSAGVIDLLLARRRLHANTICLRGNHEQILIDFLESRFSLDHWMTYGASETLNAYGIAEVPGGSEEAAAEVRAALRAKMPQEHMNFLFDLPYSYESGDYFFVHAGIRPSLPLAEQRRDDLIWIRREFLDWPRRHEKIIVHGHTPVAEPEILSNRINIDTGAFATNRLTCLVLEGEEMSFL